MKYCGMIIYAEKSESGTVLYRVLRFKMDGTVSATPWAWKSIDCAENYIKNHGF